MKTGYLSGYLLCAVTVSGAAVRRALPTVDLGYSIHQGTINTTGPYYNFSNIRYAQPPVGPLRFSAPKAPEGRNTTINDGQRSVICPQANPGWLEDQIGFFAALLTGGNITQYTNPPATNGSSSLPDISSLPQPSSDTSEDCLFLDVVVPESIFKSGQETDDENGPFSLDCEAGKPCRERGNRGAPVMVQIYGGGYVGGDKISVGNPSGLIARSLEDGGEGVIYVAMNYRLGIFGWLSGNEDITANAGLLDQRLALDWVQKNIHLFGGDPNRVTVFGESAGGGSIMHHITSYAGEGSVPFQQAIPQSPGFFPYTPSQTSEIFSGVLANASLLTNQSISTADELRGLSFENLYDLNTLVIGQAPYGTFTVGPVVDPAPNSYVPDLPGRLLAEGKFHDVPILVGHNTNEGLLFTPPYVQTQDQFTDFLAQSIPSSTAEQREEVSTELYPPVYNGTYQYTSPLTRTALAISDLAFTCNAYWLAKYLEKSYAYLFSVPPGIHGQDIPFTFYNGGSGSGGSGVTSALPTNATVAMQLQRYLTTFAMSGMPSGVEMYSEAGNVTNVNITALGAEFRDPAARSQCDFWQAAPYYTN